MKPRTSMEAFCTPHPSPPPQAEEGEKIPSPAQRGRSGRGSITRALRSLRALSLHRGVGRRIREDGFVVGGPVRDHLDRRQRDDRQAWRVDLRQDGDALQNTRRDSNSQRGGDATNRDAGHFVAPGSCLEVVLEVEYLIGRSPFKKADNWLVRAENSRRCAEPRHACTAAVRGALARTCPNANIVNPAKSAGTPTIRNTAGSDRSIDNITPPPMDPSTDPMRPTPLAQLTPVARQSVG